MSPELSARRSVGRPRPRGGRGPRRHRV